MSVQDAIADRQASWSVTANKMKSTVERARWAVFGFSILGAFLAALASQLNLPAEASAASPVNPRNWIAIMGVLSLATATFFSQRLLSEKNVTSWVRARAIAEALKREAYKYAASAGPYADPNAANLLDEERKTIEADGDDLVANLVVEAGQGSLPRQKLELKDYVVKRIDAQINFYRTRAASFRKVARSLRAAEFTLALVATFVTAVASVSGNSTVVFGTPFDIAALTAVLTTIAGAIVAHIQASRFDHQVVSYLVTARRLEDRKSASQSSDNLVADCEAIIANENSSWIASWTKPALNS